MAKYQTHYLLLSGVEKLKENYIYFHDNFRGNATSGFNLENLKPVKGKKLL